MSVISLSVVIFNVVSLHSEKFFWILLNSAILPAVLMQNFVEKVQTK